MNPMTKASSPNDHPRPNHKEKERKQVNRIPISGGEFEIRSGRVYDVRTGDIVDPSLLKQAARKRTQGAP